MIADVRVLELPAGGGGPGAGRRAGGAVRAAAGAPRLAAFAALGLYGVLRWGTMLAPNPTARLVALVCIALGLAALGALPARLGPISRRWLAAAGLAVALVGVLAASGLPLGLIGHARVAVAARRIGDGLDALPAVLVPYGGPDAPLREVMLIGAGVLLLDAAAMLAFSTGPLGELRLAVASLPLVVLALVPAALARPALPYLQGAVLFVALVAFVLGGRIRAGAGAALLPALTLATVAGMALAPALAQPRPWFDFERLTAQLSGGRGEMFDWAQGYGPLGPDTGQRVLTVSAPRPSYWKVVNQDVFDGYGWSTAGPGQSGIPPGGSLRYVSRRAYARWRETISVHVQDMSSSRVIFAGSALGAPSGLAGIAAPSPGGSALLASPPLAPGARYAISVYAPQPTAAQLSGDPARYPSAIARAFLQIQLPPARGGGAPATVSFSPFGAGSGAPPAGAGAPGTGTGPRALAASPYERVYSLARRLAAGAPTPYALALAIERHLGHGFTYTPEVPRARYPIAAFLLSTHAGYCQQFAGAMALLLRMDGVPARVVSGFATGTPSARGTWEVSDLDAHSWVEAFFDGYGWVTFDPTPAGSRGPGPGSAPPASISAGGSASPSGVRARAGAARRGATPGSARAGAVSARRAGSPPAALLAAAAAGAALALLTLAAAGAKALCVRGGDRVDELQRAFARAGRPLAGGTTLAALEQRLSGFPDAAAYVRELRLQRYAAAPIRGEDRRRGAQRRALRRALADGRGVVGRLRALWALPPRCRLHWR